MYTQVSPFRVLATQGILSMADEKGAHWLISAISSHLSFNEDLKRAFHDDPSLESLHFWRLRDDGDGAATLYCNRDSGEPTIVSQHLEYTDFEFDKPEHVFFCGKGPGNRFVLCMPEEH